MKNTKKLIGGTTRVLVCAAFITGLLLNFTFRQTDTAKVSAQTSENEIVASPGSTIVTRSSVAPIVINDSQTPPTVASPYPSTISVSGLPTVTTRVEVVLRDFSHTFPGDVDVVLIGPGGQRVVLMSDAGGDPNVVNQTLTFTPTATAALPDNAQIVGGIYRPTNYEAVADNFPAPGPGATNPFDPTDLSVFNGTNPNGNWSLYVVDDAGVDSGFFSSGWSLVFTLPTVFTVNSTADPGTGVCDGSECTLREAITAAQNGDLINFSSLFDTPQTINLTTALPEITRSITIQGKGANLLTVRRDFNATTDFRIFTIVGGITNGVAISGMTITGGRAIGGFGGGILSNSHLTLTNVHVTGNHTSVSGGGVSIAFADGVFTNCTFSGNTATGSGGGIDFLGDGGKTLRIVNSTISGNRANSSISNFSINDRVEITGSTIANNSNSGISTVANAGNTATTTLRNTIIAGNTPNNLTVSGSGAATFETRGFNLSDNFNGVFTPIPNSDITSATPRLAPLALYGGQTPTHALLADSPAIDKGDSSGLSTDQRGRVRAFNLDNIPFPNASDGADIGAVEIILSVGLVDSLSNTGFGSLRQTILSASPNSDILFDPTVFNQSRTITLTSGGLVINKNLNIIGTGANLLTVSGNDQFRVFTVNSGNSASLSGMTISRGRSIGAGSEATGINNSGDLNVSNCHITDNLAVFGGISNAASGTLTIVGSTVSNNRSGAFNIAGTAGIDNAGILSIVNSTISGNVLSNTSDSCGGGILNRGGSATIINSTIANNTAAGNGSAGGIRRESGTVTIRNSIIAGNVNNSNVPDVFANGGTGITSNGFNLIGNRGNVAFGATGDQSGGNGNPIINPLLGTLQNNGGTTPTHALFANSLALDRGNSSGFTSDQRGLSRPFDLGPANVSDGSDVGAFEAQPAPAKPTLFDYDGDGKTDISIFRPAPGEWWINRSSNGTTLAAQFGATTDKLIPADYTGDGKTDIAFWRPSTGQWFVLRSEDSSFFAFPFGTTGDLPAPADYDGDGKADPAVFRPSTLTWFISKSSGGTDIVGFGAAGDLPTVADYDGDRKADIAIFRPNGATGAEWWIRYSSTLSVFATQFGTSTDKAVQGDYTGDGKADIAFWRPSNGSWFILRSEDLSFFAFTFGTNGDTPAPGDYDGDGRADAAVFRPSSTIWFIQRSTAGTLIQQFGIAGDIPTPGAFIP